MGFYPIALNCKIYLVLYLYTIYLSIYLNKENIECLE